MNRKKRVAKNAILNGIKQLCTIVFPLIVFPYVSRVLGVDNYGKVNFSASIITYISMIAALGVNGYAIREGARLTTKKEDFQKFASEIFSINVIATVIAYLILFILMMGWGKLVDYRTLIVIQSFTVFFTTIGMDWINSAFEDFGYITIRYLICQTASVILTFVLVKSSEDYCLYAFTASFGIISANVLNFIHIRKKWELHPRITFKNLGPHWKPILILFANSISSLIYINSDITLLGMFKGDDIVGYYSFSTKIYTIVKQLFAAVMIVAVPYISSNIDDKEKTKGFINSILSVTILVVAPATVGLYMLSPQIVSLLAGNEYARSETSLQILAIALYFASIACFFVNVVMISFRKEKWILIGTTICAGFNIILNLIFIPNFDELATAFSTLASEALIMTICFTVMRGFVSKRIIKPFIISFCGMITVYFVLVAVTDLELGAVLTICLGVVGSIFIYGLLLLIIYRERIGIFRQALRKK